MPRGSTNPGAEQAQLKVAGAGFGRTGTMSLKLALEQLGFGPCYHMTEIVKNRDHARLWRVAHSGQPVDWGKLFAGYRAAVDWPACHYYRELMDAFPQAKVILTVRDPDQWYESMANTLYSLKIAADSRRHARAEMIGGSHDLDLAPGRQIWADTFSDSFEDRQHTIEVFTRHNAEVVSTVPAARLLLYQVSEGWEPLCDFLGVEVPDLAYPHVNTTQSFREYNRTQLARL